MRTNIEIDDDILREAPRLVGTKTKRDTVDLALRELVARHRQTGILQLRGKVHWEGDLAQQSNVLRTGVPLLHADADFDRLATCTPLRIWNG